MPSLRDRFIELIQQVNEAGRDGTNPFAPAEWTADAHTKAKAARNDLEENRNLYHEALLFPDDSFVRYFLFEELRENGPSEAMQRLLDFTELAPIEQEITNEGQTIFRFTRHLALPLTDQQIERLPPDFQELIGDDGYIDKEAFVEPIRGGIACYLGCGKTFDDYEEAAKHVLKFSYQPRADVRDERRDQQWCKDACEYKNNVWTSCAFEAALSGEKCSIDWDTLPFKKATKGASYQGKFPRLVGWYDLLLHASDRGLGLPRECGLLLPTPYHAAYHLKACPRRPMTLLEWVAVFNYVVTLQDDALSRGKDKDKHQQQQRAFLARQRDEMAKAERIFLPEDLPDLSLDKTAKLLEDDEEVEEDNSESGRRSCSKSGWNG